MERVLFEDSRATEHRDALGGTALSVLGFLGAHVLGYKVGPIALRKVHKAVGPSDFEADNFRHAAVISEEMLWSSGGNMTSGQRDLEGADAWPLLDGVDQIGGRRIGEGVGHLVEDVVRLDHVDDGCWLGGPEVLEAA